jgi:hypothetical protein
VDVGVGVRACRRGVRAPSAAAQRRLRKGECAPRGRRCPLLRPPPPRRSCCS